MATKRSRPVDKDSAAAPPALDGAPPPKKARHGFRVGPANLPDGPWRRKLARTKQELIQSAKVKKAYAKLKAKDDANAAGAAASSQMHPERLARLDGRPAAGATAAAASSQMHPERLARLDDRPTAPAPVPAPAAGGADRTERQSEGRAAAESEAAVQRGPSRDGVRGGGGRGRRRPDYFRKDLAVAEKRKREVDEREAEHRRRQDERERAVAARRRKEKAMSKAKLPGRDGRPRLGRESRVLLDKVKKLVGR